ncbi:MAG: DUF4158 domain-containing protein, partial [Oligoflexia bacterium]|nr:DUF4158 domain-containing protein [Oligoflexia bacterium]
MSLDDLITYFTLTESDKKKIKIRRGDHNRLGFALQLGTLRYLGFCLDDLQSTPFEVIDFLSQQLGCFDPVTLLNEY